VLKNGGRREPVLLRKWCCGLVGGKSFGRGGPAAEELTKRTKQSSPMEGRPLDKGEGQGKGDPVKSFWLGKAGKVFGSFGNSGRAVVPT